MQPGSATSEPADHAEHGPHHETRVQGVLVQDAALVLPFPEVRARGASHAVNRVRVERLWWLPCGVALALVLFETTRRITWYLAVDQLGYLTFARDLLHGRVAHPWPPLAALRDLVAPPVDMLAQTYVFDGHGLYCRYAPGYPLILAAAMAVAGDTGAFHLNVGVLALLLVTLLAVGRRLLGSGWIALVATVLVILCPTWIALWAMTPLRDLPAHLAALAGLLLLLGGTSALRLGGAGFAIGFAASIRPDAILYAIPAAGLVLGPWWAAPANARRMMHGIVVALLGGLLGAMPLLAYDTIATGNPFHATQGMEAAGFLSGDAATAAATQRYRGSATEAVAGGGLRLANLHATLPANFRLVREAFGDVLLSIGVIGVIFARRRRGILAIGAAYPTLALLFFSCWGHADQRYLVGAFLGIALAIGAGIQTLLRGAGRLVTRSSVAPLGLAAAAIFTVASMRWETSLLWSRLPAVPALLVLACLAGAVGSCAGPHRRAAAALGGMALAIIVAVCSLAPSSPPATILAELSTITAFATMGLFAGPEALAGTVIPLLGLGLVALLGVRVGSGSEPARFQEPALARARQTFAAAVPPGAVVVTTEDVGRPAENIEYYSSAHAVYLTDLQRWHMTLPQLVQALSQIDTPTYALFPFSAPTLLELDPAREMRVERVRTIPASDAIDYFVAASFHRGISLGLYRLTPSPRPESPPDARAVPGTG